MASIAPGINAPQGVLSDNTNAFDNASICAGNVRSHEVFFFRSWHSNEEGSPMVSPSALTEALTRLPTTLVLFFLYFFA